MENLRILEVLDEWNMDSFAVLPYSMGIPLEGEGAPQ